MRVAGTVRRVVAVAALAALVGGSFAGCSFGRYPREECTTNGECREAFGFGYVCGDEGLCAEMPAEERCSTSWPEDLLTRPENYRDAIILGSLFDRSSDIPETQSARLAISQANDAEGLDGVAYGLVECSYEENVELDGLAMEDATAEAALWLADVAGATAIVGPATSSQTTVAFTTLNLENDFGTLIISPSATSPALTELDGLGPTDDEPGLLWRTAPPDSLQGTAMAIDMAENQVGIQSVAAVYEDGAYGKGLADAFITAFEAGGGVVERFPFSDDSTRDAAVASAGDPGYDEVLFISGEITDIVAFMNGIPNISGYAGRPVFLADGARDTALLTDIGPDAIPYLDLVHGTAPALPSGDNYEAFAAAYASAFSPGQASDSSYTPYTYDAAWLAIYGTAWSRYQEGAITGLGEAKGLRHVSSGDPLIISSTGWYSLRAHFTDGQSVDVEGASGHLDYDPATEETTAPIDIWAVDDGHTGFETLYTVEP